MSALKITAARIADSGCSRLHEVELAELRIGDEEHRRDNREILRHVVGDAECGQSASGHQHLLADLDDLDELRWVGIQVHHMPASFAACVPVFIATPDVSLGQCGRVVGPIAGHGHQSTSRLFFPNVSKLLLRCGLGKKIVDARFRGNGCRRQRVVAGDHHRFDPHPRASGRNELSCRP